MSNTQNEISQWLLDHKDYELYISNTNINSYTNQKFKDYEVYVVDSDILIKHKTNAFRILDCNRGEIDFHEQNDKPYEESFLFRDSQEKTYSNTLFTIR
jgi:hypothetical protein